MAMPFRGVASAKKRDQSHVCVKYVLTNSFTDSECISLLVDGMRIQDHCTQRRRSNLSFPKELFPSWIVEGVRYVTALRIRVRKHPENDLETVIRKILFLENEKSRYTRTVIETKNVL